MLNLLDKHYGFVAPTSPSDASRAAQAQHLDRLRAIDRYPGPPFTSADNLVAQIFSSAVIDALVKAGAQPLTIDIQQPGRAEALERDFQRRYAQATQRSMFPELLKTDLIRNLANELREGNAAALPAGLRRTIFLRAARSRALRNDVAEAGEFFSAGLALPGSEGELAARARIAEARGDCEGAIRLLRDEKEADCRSILLDIIAKLLVRCRCP